MSRQLGKPTRFRLALEDHSAEGIALLTEEPSAIIRALIYLQAGLLLSALLWVVFGRADVIVTAPGQLGPEAELRRVYTPVDGELVDIYMAEGMPVVKGDVLARIYSPTAIEVAARALDAKMKLTDALKGNRLSPAQKKAMENRMAVLKSQIKAEEAAHAKRVQAGMSKLAEQQKLKLEKARANLTEARREMERAKRDWEEYERLFRSPSGGGRSRDKLEAQKNKYQAKQVDYERAKVRLGELDAELDKEYMGKKQDIQRKSEYMETLYRQHEELAIKLKQEGMRAEMEVRFPRIFAESAAWLTLEDIDEDNFIRIKAPVTGVLTAVAFTQIGDKIEARALLAEIAPVDARMMLHVEIQEQDRGFLREEMPVKMKFNTFPYQRYGFITGELEYISPSATFNTNSKKLVYKGRVRLEQLHYSVGNTEFPLRYGMTASAEIVVLQRRLIDMALDPFRQVAG
jgi:HlyD family secretion protein